jgi:hypothetical protein
MKTDISQPKVVRTFLFNHTTEYSATIAVLSDGSIRFRYTIPGGGRIGFCSSLFCEIGEPVKPEFRRLLVQYGLRVAKDAKRLDASPWLSDQLETA